MPKFNANLSMMFNEVDFLDRFAAAAKAGFKGWNSYFLTLTTRSNWRT
jgi:hydroxypyruvate isomerase